MTIRRLASQLIFQRDGKLLVTPGENRPTVTAAIRQCAQLEAITAGSFLFRLSPVAIWGSAARGISAKSIINDVTRHAEAEVPAQFVAQVAETHQRFGQIWIDSDSSGSTKLRSSDPYLLSMLGFQDGTTLTREQIGRIKHRIILAGWPVVDRHVTEPVVETEIAWRLSVTLRPYQAAAIRAHNRAGHGVVLLPCGAGKTVVGVGAIIESSARTLILVPSREIANQWRSSLENLTMIDPTLVSVVTGSDPLSQLTITTYHSASSGRLAGALGATTWGLVIYDEVQSLPARVFRNVSAISAARRLGLSATLVREDGREAEIFAMVGPVIYDVPWVELERDGWIAPARCHEVRIPAAAGTPDRRRFKHAAIERLLKKHEGQPTLVVGSNVEFLRGVAGRFELPLLTGEDSTGHRAEVFERFRTGKVSRLAVSRIGSVGLDLPSAEIMIQVDGNFGSRQEEAQRLGRLLRPQDGRTVHFYTLVSQGTREPEYARRRQRFLVDQGYEYEILDAGDLPRVRRY